MVYVRFQVGNTVEISRVLQNVGEGITDWQPALTQSGEDIISFVEGEVFDTEGDAIGMPWEPLSPLTIAQKEHRYPGQPMLVATGTMRDSFEALVEPTQLVVENTAPYFVYHQSSAPRFKLPRRVMLALNNSMKEMVIKNFQKQIADVITKATT